MRVKRPLYLFLRLADGTADEQRTRKAIRRRRRVFPANLARHRPLESRLYSRVLGGRHASLGRYHCFRRRAARAKRKLASIFIIRRPSAANSAVVSSNEAKVVSGRWRHRGADFRASMVATAPREKLLT